MLEKRAREIVEIRLTLLAAVLLSAFSSCSLFDDWFILLKIDVRHRCARFGATDSFIVVVRISKEHFYEFLLINSN